MNILAEITKSHLKKNVPDLQIGDTVRVHQKIRDVDAKGKDRERIQIYEGIVIARKHGNGIEGTFTVRKIAAGSIGVERVFPLHSPNIVKIERVKTAKTRQSKLYFLRDLRSSAMRLHNETQSKHTWEEPEAEAEIEALKEEAAAAAEEKAEEQAEEEAQEMADLKEKTGVTDETVATEQEAVEEQTADDAPSDAPETPVDPDSSPETETPTDKAE